MKIKDAMHRKAALFIVLFAALLFLVSCGAPSENDVRSAFQKEHPSAEIVSIGAGEGDGGAVYMHIKYRLPGESLVHEAVWQYLDKGGSSWELIHKETIHE